jgi:hypothetical protein
VDTSTVHPIVSEVYYAEKDDWVEISNPSSSTSTINLSQYRLRDTSKTNKVDLQGNLPPGGYAVFAFGNKLNNAGDTVRLVQVSNDLEIDSLSFGKSAVCTAPVGQSVFRVAGNLKIGTPTKGTENKEGNSCVVQTDIPKQTASPTPTLVPTTPPTSDPEVLSSTAAPIVEAVVAQPAVSTSEASPSAQVLYESDVNENNSLSYSPLGYLFISLGVICLVASVVLGIFCVRRYNRRHRYEKSIDQPLS